MESVESPVDQFEHWYDEDLHQDAIAPTDYCRALVDEMGLECGDVFRLDGELLEVHTIDTHQRAASNNVVVSIFARDDPQAPHTDTDELDIRTLYSRWMEREAIPVETASAAAEENSSTQHPVA